MGYSDSIIRRSLSGTALQAISLGNTERVLIRCTQDTRFATDEGLIGSSYFTITANTTLVLDPPNFFNELVYCRLDSAASGVVEIWSMGVN